MRLASARNNFFVSVFTWGEVPPAILNSFCNSFFLFIFVINNLIAMDRAGITTTTPSPRTSAPPAIENAFLEIARILHFVVISLLDMKTKSKRCRFETAHDNFVLYWNPAHAWILLMAYLGLAYNLKVGCASRHCQSCLGGASSHICSIIAMSCHRMAAGIVMRLRSPPLCVAGEEKDPEKAISELKKAAVFFKNQRESFSDSPAVLLECIGLNRWAASTTSTASSAPPPT
eukprot:COSAG04_NODE_1116_length_8204_cov_135.543615_3_plen_231_part_00